MADARTRVVVVRGHQATPWELAPWELLPERFHVRYLRTQSNPYDLSTLDLEAVEARTMRDFLPKGRVGDLVSHAVGDRYLGLEERLRGSDIVHAEELSYWFAAEAARLKPTAGYRLALTVWETLPLGESFRNPAARRRRRRVLDAVDLFLPTTDRAAAALRLEGVGDERIVVSPPGIDVDRFRVPAALENGDEHVLLSVGRLVWEKGHQDLLRALAAVRAGLVGEPPPAAARARIRIVGEGPERDRLESYARELGLADAVAFDRAGYDAMPGVFAGASCLILASLPLAGCSLGPLGLPRCFWEEQFGMVLAEAMAAGLPIVASASGAIPEVTADAATLFAAGDWLELATCLADVLRSPPDTRVDYPHDLVARYSRAAAADRLAAAYDAMLSGRST